ncbi:MAG: site-specific integrase [Hydrococcus sp. RU_2_2]|nr:site-specific integrase [Hydrococcus sp. RU_2_2]
MPPTRSLFPPNDLKLSEPVPLTLHPAGVYLSGLGVGSRRTIRYSLNTIADILTQGACDALTLDWSKLRYSHTAAVRVVLIENFAPTTANKMLSALRRVLLEAYRLDLIDAPDYQKAIDFPNVAGEAEPKGRYLRQSEIAAILETCSPDSPLDIRDAAIIVVLRGTGMRRSELTNVSLEDYSVASGELFVRKSKGAKSREVYLPDGAIPYLQKWLSIRGDRPGALFCRVRRGGHLDWGRMHSDTIWKMLQKRAALASLDSLSPHDFRRTFCSDLLEAKEDIVTIQKLAGHASPATTAKYDRRGSETRRKAAQNLSIPPQKRK